MLRVSSSRCLIYKVHAAPRQELHCTTRYSVCQVLFSGTCQIPYSFVPARASHELLHVTTSSSPCQVLFSKFSLEEHRLADDANSFMLPHVFVLVKHFFQKFSGRLAVFPSASVLSPKRSVNIPDTAPLVNYFFRLFPFSLSGGQMSAEAPLAAH